MNKIILFAFVFTHFAHAQLVQPQLKAGKISCSSQYEVDEGTSDNGWTEASMEIKVESKTKKTTVILESIVAKGGYDCAEFCQAMLTQKMPYILPLRYAHQGQVEENGQEVTRIVHLFEKPVPKDNYYINVSLTEIQPGVLFSWTGYGEFPQGWYDRYICHYL